MIDLLESLVSSEFIRAFALTLFHSFWQGALFALLTSGIILLLRKYRPAMRYAVLYTLLVLFPVFFIATFIIVYNPENEVSLSQNIYTTNTPHAEIAPASVVAGDIGSDPVRAMYLMVAGFFENNARSLVMIWLIGFLFFLIRFSGSVFYVYRLKNHRVYKVDDRWDTHLRRLSDRLGLQRTVKLAESGLARIPMTIGYLKPVILLPIGTLSGVPPQQIDAILLHELAHILRKDYLLNIVQSVIELLFFYHPFTWWLSGLIRQEREHICDDLAVNVNQDHINYIKALTTMEELNSKSPLLASAMTGSKKKLLTRVKRLINPVKLRKGFGQGTVAFLVLISLVFTLSFNALSIIPSTFDLTGRESGENVYNLLPFNPVAPDTMTAVSSSGKVKITVYTDSASQGQQEKLQQMAESMDKQAGKPGQQNKVVVIKADNMDDHAKISEQQCRVIVINKSDSTGSERDSLVVIYNNDDRTPGPGGHCMPPARPHCPVPAGSTGMQYYLAEPGTPSGEDMRIQVYSYMNDSIDTLIFMSPGADFKWKEVEGMELDSEEMEKMLQAQQLEWIELEMSAEEMQDQMKEIQIEMERDMPDGKPENFQFYFNEPSAPIFPPEVAYAPEPPVPPAEKIIRQELRDDGLTERGRKYVVEVDSKAMYINGEKQPKEIYRKYSKLVESLDGIQLEGDQSFKIIF